MTNNDKFANELLVPGTKVVHKEYGTGIISKISSDNLYVSFDDREKDLIFPIPDSFIQDYLRIEDTSLDPVTSEDTHQPLASVTKNPASGAFSTWLDRYFDQFPARWEKEKYLWKAVQTFQERWDPDASDFSQMLNDATVDADYLLNHTRFYPRAMIVDLAQRNPSYVRSIFISLFDENVDVSSRAVKFSDEAEQIRTQYEGGYFSRNDQTLNAVSTYLWLMYPDKYYFYKYSVAQTVSSEIGLPYTSRRDSEVNKMMHQFTLMDEISAVLRQDDRSRKILDSRLDKTLYSDEQLHCMAMDFAFFIRPCYQNSKQ